MECDFAEQWVFGNRDQTRRRDLSIKPVSILKTSKNHRLNQRRHSSANSVDSLDLDVEGHTLRPSSSESVRKSAYCKYQRVTQNHNCYPLVLVAEGRITLKTVA
eukprot:1182665-Prorocentrum_minimum.AAC.2